MTHISALIPTRDRPELLADALATLAAQDVDDGYLEVIVIDDGSSCDLRGVVEDAPAGPVTFRYARQEPSGLNVGRNHAASLARGSILAYLDDDVLVSAGWAHALADAFAHTGAAGVAGRIQLQLEGPEPVWLTNGMRLYLSELDIGSERRTLRLGEYPVGANCAVTRAWFDRMGGFAGGLDRIGASLVSNGDTEFYRRVQNAGGSLVYEPDAHVLHRVPPARLTDEWFVRRAHAQGVSDALVDTRATATERRQGMAREVVRAGRALPILVRNVASGRGTIPARVWLAYCRGRFTTLRSPVMAP